MKEILKYLSIGNKSIASLTNKTTLLKMSKTFFIVNSNDFLNFNISSKILLEEVAK